jgi:lysophospholipase L1-like esterase
LLYNQSQVLLKCVRNVKDKPWIAPQSAYKYKARSKVKTRRRIVATLFILLIVSIVLYGILEIIGTKDAHGPTTTRHRNTTIPVSTTGGSPVYVWRTSWGSAMAWGHGTAVNTTVREILTTQLAGVAVKVRISNAFGNAPLAIGQATVAEVTSGANINPATLTNITFSGQASTIIAAGQVLFSDPVNFPVVQDETLAVSLYVSGADLVTLHPCCEAQKDVSYFTPNGGGNETGSSTAQPFTYASPFPRWVDALAVEQLQSADLNSVAVLGDSISDGFNSPLRWTDVLEDRIQQLTSDQFAVINEAITANTLTDDTKNYSLTGGGPPGIERLDQDALSLPGVGTLIVALGTNDLWFGETVQDLINGYQQIISQAQQAGIKIIGVTLTPRMTGKELWTPQQQIELEQVNNWILTTAKFDAVINFAPVISDTYDGQCTPTSIYGPYNSGDNLHPNAAGQTALADSIPASVFGLTSLPLVPLLIPVSPTPKCQGVEGIESAYQFFNS